MLELLVENDVMSSFFSDSIMMLGVDVRSLFLHSVPGKFLYHAGCVSSEACEPETKESVIAL